jgi:hypothetical protein
MVETPLVFILPFPQLLLKQEALQSAQLIFFPKFL